MDIYLLDNNKPMTKMWEIYFRDALNVKAVCNDFKHFMDTTDVECVVSPANSYGLMDGNNFARMLIDIGLQDIDDALEL